MLERLKLTITMRVFYDEFRQLSMLLQLIRDLSYITKVYDIAVGIATVII